MRKQQTGEVMVAMMVVMMAIVLLGRGHMGMMGWGHDCNNAAQAQTSAPSPQDKPPQPATSAPVTP